MRRGRCPSDRADDEEGDEGSDAGKGSDGNERAAEGELRCDVRDRGHVRKVI